MRSNSIIEVYSALAKANPAWTAAEERAFVATCVTRTGKWKSKAAKDRFVSEAMKRNIALVFDTVQKFAWRQNGSSEDIFQLAMVGLTEALKKWDPKRQVKISTWVRNPIKWAILRAQDTYSKVGSISDEISARNYRFNRKWSVVSVDAEVPGKEGDKADTIANTISAADVAPDYATMRSIKTRSEELHDADVRLGVKELLAKMGEFLNQRETTIVLGILKGRSLADIGVEMKLSRMRISQLSKDAFDKIRKSPLGDRLHALVQAG